MTVPVTARLPEEVIEALDASVTAGLVPNRGAAIQAAVKEWLAAHGEDAIAASYRRRYAEADPGHDALVAAVAKVSINACLADDES
ncbi:MAG: ribbon-helix-helix domain-containing protein [Acidimicrobiales bacterium]